MKIGINLKIDVTKIEKARIFEGQKGKYIDLTTFIDTEQQDDYGYNGFIAHQVTKEEKEDGVKGSIVGNSKVFWKGERKPNTQQPVNQPAQQQSVANSSNEDDIDDLPF